MSDVNLTVKNSVVINENLNVLSNSSVEGESLVLDEGIDYVNRYAPEITKGNDTMEALYNAQKDEINDLHTEIQSTIDNCFFKSLNIYGVQKWEKILHLESNADLDLNTRQDLLLTKRRFRPPFTRQNLYTILASVWGEGNFTFEIIPNSYQVIIDIHTNSPEVYLKFQSYIRSLIPSNMDVMFSVQYTHLYLFRYKKYSDMENYTYEELSRYA